MNAHEAVTLALDILDTYHLTDWHVQLDRSVRRFGVCRHRTKTIGLSRALVELNDRAEVEDTIRHEVAHALAGPDAGHDQHWKNMARHTGARPERCYDSAQVVAVQAPLALVCDTHGIIARRHRRARGMFACRQCGGIVRWVRTA